MLIQEQPCAFMTVKHQHLNSWKDLALKRAAGDNADGSRKLKAISKGSLNSLYKVKEV